MVHWLLGHVADPALDYAYGEPVQSAGSQAIEAIFWHPGNPDDPAWQRKCQQWSLSAGHERPPMPGHYRVMRERRGFPHEETEIPLL
ncbi:hypothetical protein [Luteimonas saliphila]|uniref:hypothetical protein n=1 Tax=Luteimonas saliphila TaxID=2804919 RepID=UPI003CCDA269